MSRWWDVTVSDASNALYSDPELALQASSVPPDLYQNQADFKHDTEEARKNSGGFFGSIARAAGKLDSWASNVPGWGIAKQAVWDPIDKTSSGVYWLYSNAVSQPVSTLLLNSAKGELDGNWWSTMLSGDEWANSYHQAEHISPGQAFNNFENTAEAAGQGKILSLIFGDAGASLSDGEKAKVKQNVDRFLYDTEYWKDKGGWKYNVGSGALDFAFNILDPIGGAVVGGASKTIKAARSVEFAPQVLKETTAASRLGKAAQNVTGVGLKSTPVGATGVARTRGPLLDLVMKQQTPEEAAQLPSLQKSFDWMKQDGRTVEEIANHPMWGRGRRVNPARYDLAKLIKDTPRQNLEQVWRFTVGDSTAGKELAESAPSIMKKIGQVADNRALIGSVKINPTMVAAFKADAESRPFTRDPNFLYEPPTPRPTAPGPQQDAWDSSWGALQRESDVNRQAANAIASQTPVRLLSPAQNTTFADALKAEQWRVGKLTTLADDYDELINQEKHLGDLLGTMDDWTPSASPLFGTLGRSYRSGGLALRDTEQGALKATAKSAGRKPGKVGSNFVMTAVKRGMGAPMIIVHSFGERTPKGFVNHNADDARDRVFDMLKSVKGMAPDQRLDLIGLYNQANGKVERSDALDKIHNAVMTHILVKNQGMDGELAAALRDSIKNGISDKLTQLKGGGPGAQRFGPVARGQQEIGELQGSPAVPGQTRVRSDKVATEEDGSAYVISPLAQTQLDQSDILLPIKEIQRLAARSSSSMKTMRLQGGQALDTVVHHLDSFDNLWKAATLLRPGFIPRMISDEVLARMFKFGGLATLMDTTKGTGHFFENRYRQVQAIRGKGSYVPSTGKGLASSHAIVAIGDEKVIQSAQALGLPTEKIKVPVTVGMTYGKITDERTLLKDAQKELSEALKARRAANQAGTPGPSAGYVSALRDRVKDHQSTIKEYNEYLSEVLRTAEDSTGRRLGDGDFSYKVGSTTYRVKEAHSEEWDNPIPRSQISSAEAWKNLFTRGEMLERQRFFSHAEKTGSYVLVTPDQPNHMASWTDAINKQMRQDPFHRMIAGGATDKEALEWLNLTGAGRKYMSQMGYWNRDKPQFVRSVRFMLNKYLGEPVLQQKLAKGEVITEQELRTAFSKDEFPIVHGEEIKEHSALGYRETAMAYGDKYLDRAWKFVADTPADILSRNPTFLQIHKAELQNLIRQQYHYKMQNLGTDDITPKEWEALNQKAGKLAKGKLRQVVYDPVNTNGAAGLRFIYPFFKPYVDGLDRWAGLVAERPEQLGKLAKVYNAPVAANLVTDSAGNPVGEDGMATVTFVDPVTGEKKTEKHFIPLKDRTLHLKAPWSGKPGGGIPIRMASLNTILPGDPWFDPGTGPIIQVAANELAKSSPSIGEFAQWAKILPYGPNQSTVDMLTPKYIKSVFDAYVGDDPDNVKYQRAFLDVYNMRTAQYYEQKRAGKHPDPPKLDDIKKQAKSFLWLAAFTDWASPVSIKTSALTNTPYQFYADQFQALLKADPEGARDKFLAAYGEDYMSFTDSLTKSMGIASTIPASKQAEKYKDLIAEDPDMAPLAIGDVYNGGPFSQSVYQDQMNQEIGGERVRQQITAEEAINRGREQQGWRKYMAATQSLDAELIRAGFKSYTQKGAEVFQQAKQQITQQIAEQNPAWYKAFGTTDRNAVPSRISFMEKLVQDPKMINDPLRSDMKTLRAYLIVRNQMKQALAQRGLQQVSYDANGRPTGQAADIAAAWRYHQMLFQNANVGFNAIFNRYLSNDDLQ